MDMEMIYATIMVLSLPLFLLGFFVLSTGESKGWILVIMSVVCLFSPLIIVNTIYRNNISKLSKEIENKEIISIELNGLENTSNGSTYGSINSIVYIDDDGAKTKLDCSRYHLFDAKIKESVDKKYHIAINEKAIKVTVYIPAGQSYTTKYQRRITL